MKLDYSNYLKNPILVVDHCLDNIVGKVLKIEDSGYEIELIDNPSKELHVGTLEPSYDPVTGEVRHLSISAATYVILRSLR